MSQESFHWYAPAGAFIGLFSSFVKFTVWGPTPHPCSDVGEIWRVGWFLHARVHPMSQGEKPQNRPPVSNLNTGVCRAGNLSVKPRLHNTTGCQTRCQTRCQTGLTNCCIVYTAGCQSGCTIRFDNRLNEQCCSFNTVVKPVVKPVWQPVECLFTRYSWWSNRLYNRLDNRLYRVNGV